MSNNKHVLTFSGKQVSYAPHLETDIKLLRSAERKGYYYPMLALKQIKALASGTSGKPNVFIPNINDSRAHTFQMFHVFVPGIRATVERRSNDKLIITELGLSDEYKAISKGSAKPGIYSVTTDKNKFVAKRRDNGRILAEDGRIVVMPDGKYKTPEIAAKDIAGRLEKTAGRTAAMRGEFDMVYSPLKRAIGGWRRYDAMAITDTYGFAGLVAEAMVNSHKHKHVHWISEFGGSAVFTQAMEIVSQKNLPFRDQNHSAYLFKPTTNPNLALQLANQLGFKIGKDFSRAGSPRVYISTLMAKATRARNKNDQYSLKDYGADMAKGAMGGVALAGVGLFITGLAIPGSTAIATAGAVASGIGGAELLWTKAKDLFEKPKG